jgi:hypothetical protein
MPERACDACKEFVCHQYYNRNRAFCHPPKGEEGSHSLY